MFLFLLGMVVGGCLGVLIMSLLVVAARDSREWERG